MTSQYEKFDKIIAWLFDKVRPPTLAIEEMTGRLSRNVRAPAVPQTEHSRSPMLQFTSQCSRLAKQLHQVVLRTHGATSAEREYEPPMRTVKDSKDTAGLESMLYHILHQLEYAFQFMERDIDQLFRYVEIVKKARGPVTMPKQKSKRVFFVVELAKSVNENLSRLQDYVLIKHNAPDPDLVQDLCSLRELLDAGFLSPEEFNFRHTEVLENMVRAFITAGRFLSQQQYQMEDSSGEEPLHQQQDDNAPIGHKPAPVECPDELPDEEKQAVAQLRALYDEGFIELDEFNTRAKQIIGRWKSKHQQARMKGPSLPPSRQKMASDAEEDQPIYTRSSVSSIPVQQQKKTAVTSVEVAPARRTTEQEAQAKLEAALAQQAAWKKRDQGPLPSQQQAKAQETKPQETKAPKSPRGSRTAKQIRKAGETAKKMARQVTRKSSMKLSTPGSPQQQQQQHSDSKADLVALLGVDAAKVASRRHDTQACQEHSVEKRFARAAMKLRVVLDKTFVSCDHFICVGLDVLNETKKPVNCLKFVLANAADEIKDTVEDPTSSVAEMAFPLIKGRWTGSVEYIVPDHQTPGTYQLRVSMVYSNRHQLELEIPIEIMSKDSIWKKNPVQVFGAPLETVCERDGAELPRVVTETLACLEGKCAVEGIFRKSGDNMQINRVRDKIDSGKSVEYQPILEGSSQGIHNVAGVLKLFVRAIPYPVLGVNYYNEWLEIADSMKDVKDRATRLAAYKPMVEKLPAHDARFFFALARFFTVHVLPHEEINKMTPANLAIVFGPVTCWRDDLSPMEELTNAGRVNSLVKDLFELEADLYGDDAKKDVVGEFQRHVEENDGVGGGADDDDDDDAGEVVIVEPVMVVSAPSPVSSPVLSAKPLANRGKGKGRAGKGKGKGKGKGRGRGKGKGRGRGKGNGKGKGKGKGPLRRPNKSLPKPPVEEDSDSPEQSSEGDSRIVY